MDSTATASSYHGATDGFRLESERLTYSREGIFGLNHGVNALLSQCWQTADSTKPGSDVSLCERSLV